MSGGKRGGAPHAFELEEMIERLFNPLLPGRPPLGREEHCRKVVKGLKWCSYNNHWVRRDHFSKNRSKPDGLQSRCKDCVREHNQSPEGKAARAAYEQSPEMKASRAAYNQSPEGKATRAAYRQSPEGKAQQAAWRQSPEGKAYYRERKHRRRSTFTAPKALHYVGAFAEEMGQYDCLWCEGGFIDGDMRWRPTIEHCIAVKRGGINTYDNLRFFHQSCNSSKGEKYQSECDDFVEMLAALSPSTTIRLMLRDPYPGEPDVEPTFLPASCVPIPDDPDAFIPDRRAFAPDPSLIDWDAFIADLDVDDAANLPPDERFPDSGVPDPC